jgi:hypothetical protein
LKTQCRKIQKLKHSTSKEEQKKRVRTEQIQQQHQIFIGMAAVWIKRTEETLEGVNTFMGLAVCPNHGIKGFKRYVALAIVARNIHRLGSIIRRQRQDKEKRKRGSYKKAP